MWYYIAGIPYSDELYHHGVKGQKWGIRRYQNADGTLTEEGKRRYGEDFGTGNSHSILRRIAVGDHALSLQRHRDKRESRLEKKIAKQKAKGKDTLDLEVKYEAQKQKNVDLEKYVSKSSTGKLVAQRLLFGMAGSDFYRSARARGASRGRAAVEGMLSLSIPGIVVRYIGDEERYGRLTHSEITNVIIK